jgi:membrane protein
VQILRIFYAAYQKYGEHRGAYLAAAIAYYAFFSIFPLLLFAIAIGIWFLKEPDTQQMMLRLAEKSMPQSINILEEVLKRVAGNTLSLGAIGIIGLIWAASSVFSAIEYALNLAYEVPRSRPFWRQKLLALVMAVIVGLLAASAVGLQNVAFLLLKLPELGFLQKLPYKRFLQGALFQIALVLGLSLASLLIYAVIPNVKKRISHILPGALFSGLLLFAAQTGFNWYLINFANLARVYGPLSAVIALLIWLYISASIILFGGELNAATARKQWCPLRD